MAWNSLAHHPSKSITYDKLKVGLSSFSHATYQVASRGTGSFSRYVMSLLPQWHNYHNDMIVRVINSLCAVWSESDVVYGPPNQGGLMELAKEHRTCGGPRQGVELLTYTKNFRCWGQWKVNFWYWFHWSSCLEGLMLSAINISNNFPPCFQQSCVVTDVFFHLKTFWCIYGAFQQATIFWLWIWGMLHYFFPNMTYKVIL